MAVHAGDEQEAVASRSVMEVVLALVALVFGMGAAGVALAWMNDRRKVARSRRKPEIDPKRILEARFAAGEIDEIEFNRRMRRLTYGPPLEMGPPD